MLDALERVIRIRRQAVIPTWSREDFMRAAANGKNRWHEVEEACGIQYPMFTDAVAKIDPHFQLSEEAAACAANTPTMRNVCGRIAVWFVKWAHGPVTLGLPNPYEPWIEIWEHGGAFRVEHGQFVDVYDHELMPAGAIVVRQA